MKWYRKNCSDWGQGPVQGSCDHGNELWGSIKCWKVFEQLHNRPLLKKGLAPRISSIQLCGVSLKLIVAHLSKMFPRAWFKEGIRQLLRKPRHHTRKHPECCSSDSALQPGWILVVCSIQNAPFLIPENSLLHTAERTWRPTTIIPPLRPVLNKTKLLIKLVFLSTKVGSRYIIISWIFCVPTEWEIETLLGIICKSLRSYYYLIEEISDVYVTVLFVCNYNLEIKASLHSGSLQSFSFIKKKNRKTTSRF
jgi:hypothetical protein